MHFEIFLQISNSPPNVLTPPHTIAMDTNTTVTADVTSSLPTDSEMFLPVNTDSPLPGDTSAVSLLSPASDPPLTDTPTSLNEDPGFSPTPLDVEEHKNVGEHSNVAVEPHMQGESDILNDEQT